MGTLGGFAPPFGPPPATSSPLASLGLAKPALWLRRAKPALAYAIMGLTGSGFAIISKRFSGV
jgi:hypothetical protein